MQSKFYITTAKERLALRSKGLYELKKSAIRRVNHYWSLQRCMDSMDMIQENTEQEIEALRGLNLTVEQMIVGRVVYEVMDAKGTFGDENTQN